MSPALANTSVRANDMNRAMNTHYTILIDLRNGLRLTDSSRPVNICCLGSDFA